MLGTIVSIDVDNHIGQIRLDDDGSLVPLDGSSFADLDDSIKENDRVEFDIEPQENGSPKAVRIRVFSSPPLRSKGQSCFVVMPHGRTEQEIRWYTGWYKQVIEPGVRAAGFEPILAAAQDRPNAINDEIRAHLAFDPMVVVDLGGQTPDVEPNPNVMYELGIRHAFNLPHVIMACEGQRLPFDISNQRAIMERRELIDVDVNRDRLAKFIEQASLNNYYRPMDAVTRAATLELAEDKLRSGSLLGVLVEEFRDLRSRLTSTNTDQKRTNSRSVKLREVMGGKSSRNPLYKQFLAAGGTLHQWSQIMNDLVDADFLSAPNKVDVFLQLAKKYPLEPKKRRKQASTAEPSDASSGVTPLIKLLGGSRKRRKLHKRFIAADGTEFQWSQAIQELKKGKHESLPPNKDSFDFVFDLATKYPRDADSAEPTALESVSFGTISSDALPDLQENENLESQQT